MIGTWLQERKLFRNAKDYFVYVDYRYFISKIAGAVLLDSHSLMVAEQDFRSYVEATETFWDEMPERVYSNVDSIISAFSKKK